ncbi:MAG: hypothetical protein GYB31_03050 [Bacteroidetes bacterium]|nr:hypothetical protein [Bacteroidota bacterium]
MTHTKLVFLIGILLLGSFLANANATPTASESERAYCDSMINCPEAYMSKVKVYNRTDWTVAVYINGSYIGRVYDDDYEYFTIYPGVHRITIYWPSGYYEYFDFSVSNGYTHKIWTSNYDG